MKLTSDLCPFCGAYSPRSCDLEEETGGACLWEELLDAEPDPDLLREDRDERQRLGREALRSMKGGEG